jgi:succinate dehydrogenase hydrophobic anchor subunit
MLENDIRTIKFGCRLVTMVGLEGIFLVRLQLKKHSIPFCKLVFKVTLICLLLHAIMGHDQILFEGTKNSLSRHLVNMRELKVYFVHIPLQKESCG